MNIDVSIIIVSYNTEEITRDCLLSVFGKVKNIDFEVCVVDNNSKDNSCEMIEEDFPQVKLIKNKENSGFAVANNVAIKRSRAKYVLLLNSDTILLDNSPKKFFEFMEKKENQNVGVCGGKLYNRQMKYTNSYSSLPDLKNILFKCYLNNSIKDRIRKFFPFLKTNKEPISNTEVGFISGANMFIRRKVLDEVGLFDEDFFLFFEDIELTHRITKLNYKSILLANVSIIHFGGYIEPDNMNKLNHILNSELKYYKKILRKPGIKYTIKYIVFLRHILFLDFDANYLKRIKVGFKYIFQQKI